jgi:hypothetical protein
MLYVAADSPSAQKEFINALPPNAWVFSLAASDDPALRALAGKKVSGYVQSEFDKLALDERIKQTRGMVVDFAMISGLWAWGKDTIPSATICTIRYVRINFWSLRGACMNPGATNSARTSVDSLQWD